MECHSGDSAESGVRFDTLANLKNDERVELLNKSQEQLFFRLMPPDNAAQPNAGERVTLLNWFSGELKKYGASKLEENSANRNTATTWTMKSCSPASTRT